MVRPQWCLLRKLRRELDAKCQVCTWKSEHRHCASWLAFDVRAHSKADMLRPLSAKHLPIAHRTHEHRSALATAACLTSLSRELKLTQGFAVLGTSGATPVLVAPVVPATPRALPPRQRPWLPRRRARWPRGGRGGTCCAATCRAKLVSERLKLQC